MFEKFLLKDTSGKKSITMTAFVIGFVVVNAKLIASGLTISGLTLAPFSGSEYAVAVAALGAIYVLRRAGTEKSDDAKKKKK